MAELSELKELALKSNSNITVAQAWRHSYLWQSSKIAISEIHQILIERTFNEERNYISPTLDWLPHDFSLLIDLGIDSSGLKYKSFAFDERMGCTLHAQFFGGLELRVSIKKSMKRSSTWKVVLKSGNTRIINFQDRTSSLIDPNGRTLENWAQPVDDHPIVNVISQFRNLGNSDLFRHANHYESYFQHGGR